RQGIFDVVINIELAIGRHGHVANVTVDGEDAVIPESGIERAVFVDPENIGRSGTASSCAAGVVSAENQEFAVRLEESFDDPRKCCRESGGSVAGKGAVQAPISVVPRQRQLMGSVLLINPGAQHFSARKR